MARYILVSARCPWVSAPVPTSSASREVEYPVVPPTEKKMAIQAQRNRARLHVLRDNVHRAKRDVKRKLPGAAERLKAHVATRLAYAETRK